ncbi:hypothetical protein D0T51_07870 [Parabacteroides sp. 52]|uniref:hypothetical protein n=1 Tax=unclassified Parabacteroides TaxID=2649774 RepID=UPI0013D0FD0F|nr:MULTISPECIES: hypothetical protein [unclassified Parabacteroides]MDH6535219.1 hypothetical protein [Parabacteroides sp. PM5-20]NDV55641.1 hypothetical protein [Parabacteroides sp. 52]
MVIHQTAPPLQAAVPLFFAKKRSQDSAGWHSWYLACFQLDSYTYTENYTLTGNYALTDNYTLTGKEVVGITPEGLHVNNRGLSNPWYTVDRYREP